MKAIDTLKMYAEATRSTTEDQVGRGFGLIAGDKLDEIISELEELEQLCRDMYYVIFDRTYEEVSTPEHSEFIKRMEQLELLKED